MGSQREWLISQGMSHLCQRNHRRHCNDRSPPIFLNHPSLLSYLSLTLSVSFLSYWWKLTLLTPSIDWLHHCKSASTLVLPNQYKAMKQIPELYEAYTVQVHKTITKPVCHWSLTNHSERIKRTKAPQDTQQMFTITPTTGYDVNERNFSIQKLKFPWQLWLWVHIPLTCHPGISYNLIVTTEGTVG